MSIVYYSHSKIGGQILEPIEAYKGRLPVVVQHREKFDGTGYLDGLQADQIDLRARILAVADVWEAVVSNRPYREGWVPERARKMIVENSGTHFDPKVVDAFLTVLEGEVIDDQSRAEMYRQMFRHELEPGLLV